MTENDITISNDLNIKYDIYQPHLLILMGICFLILRIVFLYTCSCLLLENRHSRYSKIEYNNELEYDDSCTICLNDYYDKEKILKLKCNHIFHEKCIKTWFEKKSNCPNCITSFSSDDNISPISTSYHINFI